MSPASAPSPRRGAIRRHLPIINGFAATVPAEGITGLAGAAGVRAITLDRQVNVQAGGAPSPSPHSVYKKGLRADDSAAAGLSGAGVTVALIDTGIAEVGDLAESSPSPHRRHQRLPEPFRRSGLR